MDPLLAAVRATEPKAAHAEPVPRRTGGDPGTGAGVGRGHPLVAPPRRPALGERRPGLPAADLAAQAEADDARSWAALMGEPDLSRTELGALVGLAEVHPVHQGQAVFDRCQAARALVAVLQGEVALGLRTSEGTFRTERIERGPAWLDIGSAWLGDPPSMDAQAMGPARIVELPVAPLTQVLAQQPGIAARIIRALARQVQAMAVNTHELMHKDAPARLAQWLHQRAQPAGLPGEAVVRLAERKRDVASQLAITPETLSRLMRSFTRQGVIEVSGYLVRVRDLDALARLAQA